jgi:hypothetical protein
MIKLYSRNFRDDLGKVFRAATSELTIATPYIKLSEADRVCEQLDERRRSPTLRVRVITDVRSNNVIAGSLDLEALTTLARSIAQCSIINLPRLHAKVYIADASTAIVTSANLTTPGLDHNFEYGVGISDTSLVLGIKRDMDSYCRLGNALSAQVLLDLQSLASELRDEFKNIERTAETRLRRRFSAKLRSANQQFLRAQVGDRSAQSLFSEAILHVLREGPLPTVRLHPTIQNLLPDLCDDSKELVINGQRFGKQWKHAVRNAQQALKRSGLISFDGEHWSLASNASKRVGRE